MWYILITRSRSEKKVAKQLLESGYTVYLPLRKEMHRWKDRNKLVDAPLFPCYLFVKCAPEKRHGVYIFSGVIKFLQWGNTPMTVHESEIERIKRACEYGGAIHLERENLQIGNEIKITSGYFKGLSGNITEVKSKGKLRIALRSLSCVLNIELNQEDVTQLLR